MRPESIVMFERLYLGALALGVVNLALSWSSTQEYMANDPAVAAAGLGSGFFISTTLMGFAIPLLLWYFIAKRGSNIAKWILVVLFGFGLISMLFSFSTMMAMRGTIGLIGVLLLTALQAGAVYMLFKPDAVAWLKAT